jgi:hypothetical protein
MIRGLFRMIGLLMLAAGFIFLVYDGARSIADQTVRLTSLEQTWSDIHQTSLNALKPAIENSMLGTWSWAYVFNPVLQKPTWLVFGVVGLLLLLLFRPRKRLIGYARD